MSTQILDAEHTWWQVKNNGYANNDHTKKFPLPFHLFPHKTNESTSNFQSLKVSMLRIYKKYKSDVFKSRQDVPSFGWHARLPVDYCLTSWAPRVYLWKFQVVLRHPSPRTFEWVERLHSHEVQLSDFLDCLYLYHFVDAYLHSC